MKITSTTRTRDIFFEPDPPEDDEVEDDDCEPDDDDGPSYSPGDWGQPGDGNYYP